MIISEEEFLDWKQHQVTQEFFKLLKKKREEMKEDHICGRYENKEFVEGKACCIQELLDMHYDEFREGIYG